MLQEFYFKESLKELKLDLTKLKISINHYNGKCFVNNHVFNLIFPKYMIDMLDNMDKTKTIDFYFKGLITDKRKWINKFKSKDSIITDSSYGRNPDTKYNLDIDYYTNMSKSKFTLCPTGDCPWSYRFFEAIMCFSIPILNDKSDIFCKDYYYIMYGDEYVYSHEQALENYNKLLTRCTLINKIIK